MAVKDDAIKEEQLEKAYSSLEANAPAAPRASDEAKYKRTTFGIGLLKGLGITFRHLVSKSVTVQYPDEIDAPSPRSRGVIALKIENCTVCMLCARECPDWCIYIEGHKESRAPKEEGKRAKKFNVLDRFAIDYALCMYCGICVEVCPYDALFWSPEFEYSDRDVVELTHEMDRLADWMYTVEPPAELDEGAQGPELKAAPAPPQAAVAGPAEQAKDIGGPVPTTSDPKAMGGQAPTVTAPAAPVLGQPAGPAPTSQPQAPDIGAQAKAAAVSAPVQPPRPKFDPEHVREAVLKAELKAGTDQKVAQARAGTAAARVVEEAYAQMPSGGQTMEATLRDEGAPAAFPSAGAEAPAGASAEAKPAEQEQAPSAEAPSAGATAEEAAAIRAQVLQEEMNKGSDPRVAEARAKAAEMRALKGTTGPK